MFIHLLVHFYSNSIYRLIHCYLSNTDDKCHGSLNFAIKQKPYSYWTILQYTTDVRLNAINSHFLQSTFATFQTFVTVCIVYTNPVSVNRYHTIKYYLQKLHVHIWDTTPHPYSRPNSNVLCQIMYTHTHTVYCFGKAHSNFPSDIIICQKRLQRT